jgi:hypothetical protein
MVVQHLRFHKARLSDQRGSGPLQAARVAFMRNGG